MVRSVSSVELLGIQIDDKLNFNLHISKICKCATNQLNALIQLKQFLSFHAKKSFNKQLHHIKLQLQSFGLDVLKYVNEIENLEKRVLRFLHDDFEASYEELISKGGKSTMNVMRLTSSFVEIYKALNDLNPSFKNNIFKLKINGIELRDDWKLIS